MSISRRHLIGSGLASLAGATIARPLLAGTKPQHLYTSSLAQRIVTAFTALPGIKALKMWSPACCGRGSFTASLDEDAVLFCGSAYKVYILAEFLRLMEAQQAMSTL